MKSDVPPTIDSFTVDPNVVTCDTHSPSSVGAVADPALGFSWSASNLTSDYKLQFRLTNLTTWPDNSPNDTARFTSQPLDMPPSGSRAESFLCADGDQDIWRSVSYELEILKGATPVDFKNITVVNNGDPMPWSVNH
ncbi:MAG TPA: hypothetical protein VGC05_04705 [Mycobacterium sp.]